MLSEQDWQIRLYIYQYFVEHEQPPAPLETADHFGISGDDARLAYHRLHDHHTLLLEPGADTVRMAWPLSAIPTDYRVTVNGRRLWANCAWDSLGIPAMLHTDATIEAKYAHSGEAVTYGVEGGSLIAPESIVHFSLPFRQWYDDVIHT